MLCELFSIPTETTTIQTFFSRSKKIAKSGEVPNHGTEFEADLVEVVHGVNCAPNAGL